MAEKNQLDVDDLTVYSYFPACHQYSTAVRVEDALAPTSPLDETTYGVRFHRLRIVRGGYMNIAGTNPHAAFLDCDLNFSECSRRDLQAAGAIASGVGLGVERRILFKNCRIQANVDNPNGRWYPGEVFTIRAGTNVYLTDCQVQETGLRARGSTGMMFGWIDPGGSVLARDCSFTFNYARGVRRLCGYDAQVTLAQRNFAGCVYASLSPGTTYTEWYGPAFGFPDIRDEVGWLSNVEGDPFGIATGQRPLGGSSGTVFHAGNEAEDQVK